MKIIYTLNLKGGCAKTTTAVSMAELLATGFKSKRGAVEPGKVLLFDNATEEVKEQFEKGNMKITSAYETSRLSEDAQKEVAAAVEAGADIKSEEIKQMSEEKKKKRKTAEDIAKEQNVSDTDTSEEEKANAKKLHAVKMLEKYYIYLSEEETGILERMLEDCKRRKREYALEED